MHLASERQRVPEILGQGREGEARNCMAQAERLAGLPRMLLAVLNHIHEGRILKAEELCRHFLRENPHNVEAMRLLADIGVRLGIFDDPEFLLESAVAFEPDNIQLRLDYMQVLRRRQKFSAAEAQAQHLVDLQPDNPLFQSHLAIENMQTGKYDKALGLFESVLAGMPDDPATLTSRGHALKTCGQQQEAIASYRAAIAARPDLGDPWYALANLKTFRFEDGEVAAMHAQLARDDLRLMDRVHLSFALGKAHAGSLCGWRLGRRIERAAGGASAAAVGREEGFVARSLRWRRTPSAVGAQTAP